MAVEEGRIATPRAEIRVRQTAGEGLALILVHGSGSSSRVFDGLLEGPLGQRRRLVAIDLPGHGESSDARDPEADYTLPGLAGTVADLVAALGLERVAVFGWSLGGHVGIEYASTRPAALAGLAITGTPPSGPGVLGILRGFRLSWGARLASQERFSSREVEEFATLCFGARVPADARASIQRADGRLRRVMTTGMRRGVGADQRRTVETMTVPLAVVNGRNDPFLRHRYLESLAYSSLWEARCHVLEGSAHAPFLEEPASFEALLERFLTSLEVGAAAPPGAARAPTA